MTGPSATVLGVLMLVAFALAGGAIYLFRRGERGKAALMLVCAAVMIGNVLIWTV